MNREVKVVFKVYESVFVQHASVNSNFIELINECLCENVETLGYDDNF